MESINSLFSRAKLKREPKIMLPWERERMEAAASNLFVELLAELKRAPERESWGSEEREKAWSRATLALSRHQSDDYFEAAFRAAIKLGKRELAVDKAELPLAMLACAVIAENNLTREKRIEKVIKAQALWSTYPDSAETEAWKFRFIATAGMSERLLKVYTTRGVLGNVMLDSFTRLAGSQSDHSWFVMGCFAGNSVSGPSKLLGAHIPWRALMELPSAFWVGFQRKMGPKSEAWKRVGDALRERAQEDKALELSLWGSALIGLSPEAVERCHKDYPRWSQKERLDEVARHFEMEPDFEGALIRRISYSNSSLGPASKEAGVALRLSGGEWKAVDKKRYEANWPNGFKKEDVVVFFAEFERECNEACQRRELKIEAAARATETRRVALEAREKKAGIQAEAGRLPARVEERDDRQTEKPGVAEKKFKTLAEIRAEIDGSKGYEPEVRTVNWKAMISALECFEMSIALTAEAAREPRHGKNQGNAFSAKGGRYAVAKLGDGHWLHRNRTEEKRANDEANGLSLAEFSAHARATAYAAVLKAKPSPSTLKRP